MNKKVLVTGGTGYIGSHTIVALYKAGYEVVVVDNLSNSKEEVLDAIKQICGKRPRFYAIDCNDKKAMETVFTENSIDAVIHFAASKAVGESVQKPLLYYRNNIMSLITLMECMERFGTKALVFSSSCTVYGQPEHLPVDESAPILPATSPYGNTKQINEEIIRDTINAGASYRATLLRYFNPIGAHPSALIGEAPNGVPQNLVPFLTQTAAGIRKELQVFGTDYNTPDGSCIRDYINVVDLAQAHIAALNRMLLSESSIPQLDIFNIGTGKGLSVLELINAFEKATGVKVPHRYADRREGDIEAVWADAHKANEELNWQATISTEETLRSAWAWQCHCDQKAKDSQ